MKTIPTCICYGGEAVGRGGIDIWPQWYHPELLQAAYILLPVRELTYQIAVEIRVEQWLISWSDELTQTYITGVVLQVKWPGRGSVLQSMNMENILVTLS